MRSSRVAHVGADAAVLGHELGDVPAERLNGHRLLLEANSQTMLHDSALRTDAYLTVPF